MIFHIITIFPETFDAYLGSSILKRAIKKKLIIFKLYNPRDYTKDKHRKVDSRPFGGGPGMVMEALPIIRAVEAARRGKKKEKIYILSPRGRQFTNKIAKKISIVKDIILISGRYEGIDSRVKKILKAEELSIGPYTLTGGEIPAMTVIDAVARQIKGVLGNKESIEEERISSKEMYTRPAEFKYRGVNYKVPKILLSGNHKKIEEYRRKRK